jgi:hypothetical protein
MGYPRYLLQVPWPWEVSGAVHGIYFLEKMDSYLGPNKQSLILGLVLKIWILYCGKLGVHGTPFLTGLNFQLENWKLTSKLRLWYRPQDTGGLSFLAFFKTQRAFIKPNIM